MTQNIIQIKPILNHQITNTNCHNYQNSSHKEIPFHNPLELLQPQNYHLFKKQYFSSKNGIDTQSLIYDMTEYTELLSNQQKRIVYQINGFPIQQIVVPLHKLLEFYTQLSKKATILIQKMAKAYSKVYSQVKKIPQKNQEELNKRLYCYQCKAEITRNQLQKLKNDLQLRGFEDKYDYYKMDAIKLFQMKKIINYSDFLVKSEIEDERIELNVAKKSISFEQFQEVLNLFGSDIDKKNSSFQSGIQSINQICRNIDEQNYHQSVGEEQLKEFEFFVGNKQMNKKLRTIFKKFYNKQNKLRAQNRRDVETQANTKESQAIRSLQKEKKELKLKLYRIQAQKIKQNKQSTKANQELNIKILALIRQNQQNVFISQQKYLQYQKKISQQKLLVQKWKLQILNCNQKYSSLQMQFIQCVKDQRTQNKNSEKRKSHTKRYTDISMKKQAMSPKRLKKKSILLKQIEKCFSENDIKNESSENGMISHKGLLNPKSKKNQRKTSIMSKKSLFGESNIIQAQKYATYECIQQKKQEQEEDMQRSKSNKLSRFRVFAGISRFNNQNINTPAASSKYFQNEYMNNQNSQKDIQDVKHNTSNRSLGNQTVSKYQYQITLKKLYDFQAKRTSWKSVTFDNFSVSYQKFIKEISSQKEVHIYGQKQLKDKSSSKDKKQNRTLSLSKNNQLRNDSNKNILKKQNKQNNQTKKVLKLEPLLRKSNYFLQKSKKKFSIYESKETISAFTSLEISKIYNKDVNDLRKRHNNAEIKQVLIQNINRDQILQSQEIVDLFGGKQTMAKFQNLLHKNQQFVLNVKQNQLIINLMALFAKLHLSNPNYYKYLKKIIVNPSVWTDTEFNEDQIQQASLQNALKTFIIVHRNCIVDTKNDKNLNCNHLQTTKSLILRFIQTQPEQIVVKKQKIKQITEKKLSRRKSQKQHFKKV